MKTIKILFICMFVSTYVFAQNVPPYTIAETNVNQPKFMAVKMENNTNKSALHSYIAKNFNYPSSDWVQEGTQVVRFVVSSSGEVSDFNIVNSVSPQIDQEVIRVLKGTNKMWTPGQSNGVPVAMEKEISVKIKTSYTTGGATKREFSEIAKGYYTKGSEKLLLEKNSKQALRYLNKGIKYQPYDKSLLYLRGLCLYELGKTDAAHEDWTRLKDLGGFNSNEDYFAENIKELKGYNEISAMLNTTE